jgi:hypothetical protein
MRDDVGAVREPPLPRERLVDEILKNERRIAELMAEIRQLL